LAAVIIFVLCSAMRLARFTAAARPKSSSAEPAAPGEEKREIVLKSKFFTGLATPSAAAAVMAPVMLAYSRSVGNAVRPDHRLLISLMALGYLCTAQVSLASRRRVLRRPVSELPDLKTKPARGAGIA